MITYNPLLCLDFYKTCHAEQYPKGLTKMVSYYTSRMSRLGYTVWASGIHSGISH